MNNTESKHNTTVGGVFVFEHFRDGKLLEHWEQPNIVVDEGITYILDTALSGGTQSTNFYIGLFGNNYTPVSGNVMSTFPGSGVAGEVTTEYNESTRPAWVEAGVTSNAIGNAASPATFTFNGTKSVYGGFLTTGSVKGGTTGKLIAAGRFASVRNMEDTDVLSVTYTLTGSST